MDKDREKVLNVLSNEVNVQMQARSIGNVFYHNIMAVNIPNTYNLLHIKEFIIICRIDCLYDKGLITLKVKKELMELFNIYTLLNQKYSDLAIRDLNGENVETEMNQLYEKIEHIEKIFSNYHLMDDIDLKEIILNSVRVDNKDLDLEEEIRKYR